MRGAVTGTSAKFGAGPSVLPGLNTSASHNHPDDNGGKFYNGQGGQEIPPNDEKMVEIVERISDIRSIPYAAPMK